MSEALCQCGHGEDCPKHREGDRWSRPNDCICPTPPPTREPIRLTAEEKEALRREAYRQLYPGHVNTHDSQRTRESDLREADRAYLIWDEKRAGYAPTSIINGLIERMAPTVESILAARLAGGPTLADAWDEGARCAGSYGHEDNWTHDMTPLTENPYRTPESEDTE